MTQALANAIEQAWESRDTLNTQTRGEVREAVEAAIDRAAERANDRAGLR